jgi:hypothetical protein
LCGENGVFKHQILGYPIFRQIHRVMWLGVNQQGMPIRKHLKTLCIRHYNKRL